MENKQYDLCLKILRIFHKVKILDEIIIIGSWCLYFYRTYFSSVDYTLQLRTRDIDFLVPIPPRFSRKVDIPGLLKDLGFVVDFMGAKGYMRMEHPELIVEFLVPEYGHGRNTPYPLPQLGLNAQALRFLDFLARNVIAVKIDGMTIKVPHPAAFALQKLLVFERRTKQDKAERDRKQAIMVLDFIMEKKAYRELKSIFNSMSESWKKKVLKSLLKAEKNDLVKLLKA